MQAIYKYPLSDLKSAQTVSAPIVRPLCVDYQDGKPCLWAVVDGERSPVDVIVVRMATGKGFVSHHAVGEYMNTTVAASEPFVWHWFCRLPEQN